MLIAIVPLFLLAQAAASDSALRDAENLLRQHRYEEAITKLGASRQQNPPSAEVAWLLLAHCYEDEGKPGESLRTLRAGSKDNPASQRLLLSLGELLFRLQQDNPEAGAVLARAAGAMPRDAEARHYYAQWAFLNDKEGECAVHERAALALPGLNDLALLQMNTLLGLCEDKLGHADRAEAAFRQALRVNHRLKSFDPSSAVQFARFLHVAGREDEALQLVNAIIAESPNFGAGHLELAKHFADSGKYAEAVEESQRALSGEGNDDLTIRSARIILVKCYSALGKTKEAEAQEQLFNSGQNTKSPN
jgi:Flp pilus assembly protein TadD